MAALDHRRPWKITVRAKISNLCINLKATVICPLKFQRLHKLLIQLDSESESESRILLRQRKTLKSRILSFLKKQLGRHRRRRSKPTVAGTEHKSWRLGRAELSCVALFSYVVAEFGHALNTNAGIIPCSALFVFVLILVLFVSWLHKFNFIWAMLISVLSLLLLHVLRFVHILDLHQFW